MPSIELHVHTKAGSADSSVSSEALAEYAIREGLGAIVVAEHFRIWADWERESFFERTGTRLYRAMEATTDFGHVIVVGPSAGFSPPRSATELLTRARDDGWFSILAHPFRHYFDNIHPSQRPHFVAGQTVEQLASNPVFEMIDAIEVQNGASTDRENAMAYAVAQHLDLPVTSGSDAHSVTELGRYRLHVDNVPKDEQALAALVRSWRLERPRKGVPLELSPPSGLLL